MSTIDDKFENFARMAINEASAKRDSAIKELEKYKAESIKNAEEECLEKAYKNVKNGVSKARQRYDDIVSREPSDCKRQLLEYRDSLISELFASLLEKVMEYKKSDEYKQFLFNSIKDGLERAGEGDIAVTVDKSDDKFSDEIKQTFGCELNYDENIIGGCIIKNISEKKIFNNSLSEKISEVRAKFLEESKFSIY